jgi:transcription elongation GreA/GreB family factor
MNVNELIKYLEDITDSEESAYRQAATMLFKQQEEIEYWKEMFEKAMSVNEQIRYLEAQVYGGTTK